MSWTPWEFTGTTKYTDLIGLKVGSWLGQAEDFIGVGCLRPHSFGPSHHDAIGPPLHHPQVFLLGLRMASVMKRVVENSGDAQIVFAAILKIACNVLREGRILFTKDVTTVLQPQNNRTLSAAENAPPRLQHGARGTRTSCRCRVRSSTDCGSR